MSLALGADRESKDINMGKASRIQSSRIGSPLMSARRNAQHCELKLPESARSLLIITVVRVAVSTNG